MILVRELPRSTLFGLGRVIGGAAVVIMLLLAGFHLAKGWGGSAAKTCIPASRRVSIANSQRATRPRAYHRRPFAMRVLAPKGLEVTMNEDELIGLLRERQNNGRTGYLTFGDLVAMVPSDQMDEWRAVLAKARAADAARDAEEDRD